MSGKIAILDERTINQIAAGEVIENGASVVKELIENARDAGADEIVVEVKGGGRQLIRVTDNGCGMNREDALLCLERHGTSKLRALDDLEALDTMGFRGEAIPSIASISHMTLLTSEGEGGTAVVIEGGKVLSCGEAARNRGTTVEVRKLFYNVPVRKRFQKSPQADSQSILKICTHFALSNPTIQMKVLNESETVLGAPKQGEMKERIGAILGEHFLEEGHPISFSQDGIHCGGWCCAASYNRPNRTGQYLFVNGRHVISLPIGYAVKEGYGTALPPDRFPLFVLQLTLPGTEVDVNVHPQKREVRLHNEHAIREWITKGIREAIQPSFDPQPHREISLKEIQLPKEEPLPWTYEPSPTKEIAEEETPYFAPKFSARVLTTLPGYWVVEGDFPTGEEALYIVDQKQAHARLLYEDVEEKKKVEVQTLIVPITFTYSPAESDYLRENLDALQQVGIQIRSFGPQTFVVDGLSTHIPESELKSLLDNLLEGKHPVTGNQLAKQALSQKRKITTMEAQELLKSWLALKQPLLSPFGKPCAVIIKPEEVAKWFT